MSILIVEEAIRFFKSYGFRVDEKSVREWVTEINKKANPTHTRRQIVEEDLYRYYDWLCVKGTAYEEGIDDKTKINRLLDEVSYLRKENERLKDEKRHLEDQMSINDWIWE